MISLFKNSNILPSINFLKICDENLRNFGEDLLIFSITGFEVMRPDWNILKTFRHSGIPKISWKDFTKMFSFMKQQKRRFPSTWYHSRWWIPLSFAFRLNSSLRFSFLPFHKFHYSTNQIRLWNKMKKSFESPKQKVSLACKSSLRKNNFRTWWEANFCSNLLEFSIFFSEKPSSFLVCSFCCLLQHGNFWVFFCRYSLATCLFCICLRRSLLRVFQPNQY